MVWRVDSLLTARTGIPLALARQYAALLARHVTKPLYITGYFPQ